MNQHRPRASQRHVRESDHRASSLPRPRPGGPAPPRRRRRPLARWRDRDPVPARSPWRCSSSAPEACGCSPAWTSSRWAPTSSSPSVCSRWGRAHVLIPLGFAIAAVLVAGEVIDVPLRAGTGDRTVVVDTPGQLDTRHELFAGELTPDLTDAPLAAGRTTEVDAVVGMGELRVLLPHDAVVEVEATAGVGEVTAPGGPEADESGVRVDTSFVLEPPDEPGADADRAEDGPGPRGDPAPRLAL